jgi:hypothetical protein
MPKTESLARLSLGLFLAGTLGTLLLMTVSCRHDMALIFGGVALVLAFVFGCLGWRQRMGKFVVITLSAVVLVVVLGASAAFLFWGMSRDRAEASARNAEARARLDQVKAMVVASNKFASSQPALLASHPADAPKLLFLASLAAYLADTNRVFHPNGSPVVSAEERLWVAETSPKYDVTGGSVLESDELRLWFSIPAAEDFSNYELDFLDGSGNPVPAGPGGSTHLQFGETEVGKDTIDWFTMTVAGHGAPPRATLRLTYTSGSGEAPQEIVPKPNVNLLQRLEDESLLSAVGENADGDAFVSITTDPRQGKRHLTEVVAIAKDGREIGSNGSASLGDRKSETRTQLFDFRIHLADVAKFRIAFRPIHTVEWKDVLLPK